MELLISLLRQLSASLTPTEFVLVILASAGAIIYSIRFLSRQKKKGGLLSLLSGDDKDSIEELKKAADAHAAQLVQLSAQLTVVVKLTEDLGKTAIDHRHTLDKFVDEAHLRTETYSAAIESFISNGKNVEATLIQLVQDMAELKRQHDLSFQGNTQAHAAIADQQRHLESSIERLTADIEKHNEDLNRNIIPEFRVYHKDLSKELSNLARDVVLIERGIQNHINNVNAVKLR